MQHPDDRRYTQSHEWVQRQDDGSFRVGITEHAQDELGDLVFVEQPDVDARFALGETVVVIESVKAAADVYCPCACTVTAVNEGLAEHPERVNDDPHGAGWLYAFTPSGDFAYEELLDADGYADLIG